MPSIAGSAVIVDRIVTLLREYINATVDEVDTAANALGESFTTPDLEVTSAPYDVVAFTDDYIQNRERRILVYEVGPVEREHRYADDDGTASLIRWIRRDTIGIEVSATAESTANDVGRAYREVDRIKEAVAIILTRFSTLQVPAQSLGAMLNHSLEILQDSRVPEPEEDIFCAARKLIVETRREETA